MAKHDHPGGGPVNKSHPGDNDRAGAHNRAIGGEDQSAGYPVGSGPVRDAHTETMNIARRARGKK